MVILGFVEGKLLGFAQVAEFWIVVKLVTAKEASTKPIATDLGFQVSSSLTRNRPSNHQSVVFQRSRFCSHCGAMPERGWAFKHVGQD